MTAKVRVVGLVGGVDRATVALQEVAADLGHRLEVHHGRMNGTGDRELTTMVLRSDVVVVTTDVNSHAGVRRARELARIHQRPCVLVRRFGVSRLRSLLGEIEESATEGDCRRSAQADFLHESFVMSA